MTRSQALAEIKEIKDSIAGLGDDKTITEMAENTWISQNGPIPTDDTPTKGGYDIPNYTGYAYTKGNKKTNFGGPFAKDKRFTSTSNIFDYPSNKSQPDIEDDGYDIPTYGGQRSVKTNKKTKFGGPYTKDNRFVSTTNVFDYTNPKSTAKPQSTTKPQSRTKSAPTAKPKPSKALSYRPFMLLGTFADIAIANAKAREAKNDPRFEIYNISVVPTQTGKYTVQARNPNVVSLATARKPGLDFGMKKVARNIVDDIDDIIEDLQHDRKKYANIVAGISNRKPRTKK